MEKKRKLNLDRKQGEAYTIHRFETAYGLLQAKNMTDALDECRKMHETDDRVKDGPDIWLSLIRDPEEDVCLHYSRCLYFEPEVGMTVTLWWNHVLGTVATPGDCKDEKKSVSLSQEFIDKFV